MKKKSLIRRFSIGEKHVMNSSYSAMESYLNEAFERFEGDEAHIQLFLQDLDNWKSHYSMLQSTSSFLMEACDENIASNLQQKMAVIHCNWSYLLQVQIFVYFIELLGWNWSIIGGSNLQCQMNVACERKF